MKAEILTIGTELLLGQIVNTNTVYFSHRLNELGIDCLYQTTVGDNKDRIKECLKIAFDRADIILTSGGLGPTSDDLTIETIAEFFSEELIFDQEWADYLAQFFAERGRTMVSSNLKQAYRPKTAMKLNNPVGTAPGIIWRVDQYLGSKTPKVIITFPGVPRELKAMWEETVHSYLANNFSAQQLFYKELKFIDIGESALAERMQKYLDKNDPTVAPLAGNQECRLRIATKGNNRDSAFEKINQVISAIREEVGEYIYGEDQDTLELAVGRLLIDKKKTVSLAESCTGGLLSQRMTSISGSSQYIGLNIVTYSNIAKEKILKVKSETLLQYGAVSHQTVYEMAEGMIDLADTDYAIAISGIAGPTSDQTNKPVGLVYIAIADGKNIETHEYNFGNAERDIIRYGATQKALNLLRLKLLAS